MSGAPPLGAPPPAHHRRLPPLLRLLHLCSSRLRPRALDAPRLLALPSAPPLPPRRSTRVRGASERSLAAAGEARKGGRAGGIRSRSRAGNGAFGRRHRREQPSGRRNGPGGGGGRGSRAGASNAWGGGADGRAIAGGNLRSGRGVARRGCTGGGGANVLARLGSPLPPLHPAPPTVGLCRAGRTLPRDVLLGQPVGGAGTDGGGDEADCRGNVRVTARPGEHRRCGRSDTFAHGGVLGRGDVFNGARSYHLHPSFRESPAFLALTPCRWSSTASSQTARAATT